MIISSKNIYSTYITYLFYSFKRGDKLWREYFNNCIGKIVIK